MSKRNSIKRLAEELDVFDDMLTSLVELLEKRGILTQEEWERRIQIKVNRKTKSYRNIQF